MQKLSDAPLSVCPVCGQPTFSKQITAAGFQLKGSGWYATDFKNGSKGAKKESTPNDKAAEKTAESKTTEGAAEKKSDSAEKKSDSAEKKSESNGTKPAAPATGSGS
jgi:predicted nucleic acid-binding Zn ribbon protein